MRGTPERTRSKQWVPYHGPEGGEGWQDTETGEVVYQNSPPGEIAEPAEAVEALEGVTQTGDQTDLIERYRVAKDRERVREHGGSPPPDSLDTLAGAEAALGEDPADTDIATAVDALDTDVAADYGALLSTAIERGATPHEVVRGGEFADAPLTEYEQTAEAMLKNTSAEVKGFDADVPLAVGGGLYGGPSEVTEEFRERFEQEFGEDATHTVYMAAQEWVGSMFGEDAAPLWQVAADETDNETIPESSTDGVEITIGESDLAFGTPDYDDPRELVGETVTVRNPGMGEREAEVINVYGDDSSPALEVRLNQRSVLETHTSHEDREDLRQFATATQELLREAFGDSITVFRGYSEDPSNPTAADATSVSDQLRLAHERGEPIEHEHRTAEAWSMDPTYADRYNDESYDGAMVRKEVPVERVMLSAHTSKTMDSVENEVVVAHDEAETYEPEDIVPAEEADAERLLLEAARSVRSAVGPQGGDD